MCELPFDELLDHHRQRKEDADALSFDGLVKANGVEAALDHHRGPDCDCWCAERVELGRMEKRKHHTQPIVLCHARIDCGPK